jgi:hypothetical protein
LAQGAAERRDEAADEPGVLGATAQQDEAADEPGVLDAMAQRDEAPDEPEVLDAMAQRAVALLDRPPAVTALRDVAPLQVAGLAAGARA